MAMSFLKSLLVCSFIVLGYANAGLAQAPEPAPAATPAQTDPQAQQDVVITRTEIVTLDENMDLLDAIRQRGKLRVGVSMFVPWVMRANNGELMGYEIDVAKQLAKDLGVEPVFVPNSWNSIIGDLLEEQYDIIISGLSVTPTRALQVEFSDFYSFSEFNVLANRQQAGDFNSLDAFDDSAVTLGVRAGAVAADVAKRTFPEAVLKDFDSEAALYEAVREGTVHGVVAASPRPELEARRFSEQVFLPLAKPIALRGEAFAVRTGNQRLLNFLNSWIDYQNFAGFLSERRRYWFNSVDWADKL